MNLLFEKVFVGFYYLTSSRVGMVVSVISIILIIQLYYNLIHIKRPGNKKYYPAKDDDIFFYLFKPRRISSYKKFFLSLLVLATIVSGIAVLIQIEVSRRVNNWYLDKYGTSAIATVENMRDAGGMVNYQRLNCYDFFFTTNEGEKIEKSMCQPLIFLPSSGQAEIKYLENHPHVVATPD